MSSVLIPLAPSGATARDAPVWGHAHGPRPATPVETALAVRPVPPESAAEKLRNPSAQERPVGPPPTFDVNVLEDMRERLRQAPTTPHATSDRDTAEDPQSGALPVGPPLAQEPGVYPDLSEPGAEGAHLDRKL